MCVKSSPLQQDVMVESLTADFLVLGQPLYHSAILPPTNRYNILLLISYGEIGAKTYRSYRNRNSAIFSHLLVH